MNKRIVYYVSSIKQGKHEGFGLMEVIVAVGIWAVLASAGVMMTTGSLRLNSQSSDYDRATLLASEGIEAVRSIKKTGWFTPFLATDCAGGCGVATVSGTWGFSGANDLLGKYTRQVLVTPVGRDALGNIVSSGGTTDSDTYKVESKVTWARTPVITGNVSLVSYVTNFIKAIVSVNGGILIYGDGSTTPKFRNYDGDAGLFTPAQGAISGGSGNTFQMRSSPTKTEVVAGYVTSGGVLQVMCSDGYTWTNEWSVNVGGDALTRRFDIAYETNSGDVMILYSRNVGGTNELGYRTRSGSVGCGSGNWTNENVLDPVRTSGVVQWVKMAWDVRGSSDLITASWADSNSDLSAMVWSGTSWINEPSNLSEANLERVTVSQDVDSFDVAYESLSGDVMLVWGTQTTSNNSNGVRYRVCNGGVASCTWGAVTTPPTWRDDATNLDLAPNPVSDEIVFASIGNQQNDLQTGFWDGSTWTNRSNVDNSAGTPMAGTKLVASAWLANGATSRWITVYMDSSGNDISWYMADKKGSPSRQKDFVPTPSIGDPKKWIEIKSDPVNTERLVTIISDTNNDLFVKKLVMDASANFTWSDVDGGGPLEANLSQAVNKPYAFCYWRQ